VTNTVGAVCVRDGESPAAGFARYPRGRVPVWINPPRGYAHRTDDGEDRYNVSPNDPDYPWWDEVLEEHPEFACDSASEPLTAIPMEPRGEQAPKVAVLLNSVGNRCFGFAWGDDPGTAVSSELTVWETRSGPEWETAGRGAEARQLLRVASDSCLRVTASFQVEAGDGTRATYRLDRARVPRTCNDYEARTSQLTARASGRRSTPADHRGGRRAPSSPAGSPCWRRGRSARRATSPRRPGR
jgi:hypothetical protein